MELTGLERDANALIRAIMCEIEAAASEDPAIGAHPYRLQERRTRIIRQVWHLVRRKQQELSNDHKG